MTCISYICHNCRKSQNVNWAVYAPSAGCLGVANDRSGRGACHVQSRGAQSKMKTAMPVQSAAQLCLTVMPKLFPLAKAKQSSQEQYHWSERDCKGTWQREWIDGKEKSWEQLYNLPQLVITINNHALNSLHCCTTCQKLVIQFWTRQTWFLPL